MRRNKDKIKTIPSPSYLFFPASTSLLHSWSPLLPTTKLDQGKLGKEGLWSIHTSSSLLLLPSCVFPLYCSPALAWVLP